MVFQRSMLDWGSTAIDPCYTITLPPATWPEIHATPVHFPCQLTIDPCYTDISHKSALGICALCYMWNWFGVMVLHAPMINWLGVHLPSVYMCISYMWNWFGVMVFQTTMLNWGSICLWYVCVLSYVSNLCGVMVLHAAMVNWMGVHLPLVYMWIFLGETYLV